MATGRASSDFDDGNSEYLEIASGTAGPQDDINDSAVFTHVTWVKMGTASTGANKKLFAMQKTFSDEGRVVGSESSHQAWGYAYNDSFGWSALASATSFDTNWHHRTSLSRAADDHEIYVDSTSVATGSSSKTGIGMDITYLGRNRSGEYLDGLLAFTMVYLEAINEKIITDIMWNPFSHVNNIVWMPNLLANAATVGAFIDLSGKGYNPDAGTIPAASSEGPPIFLLGGQ